VRLQLPNELWVRYGWWSKYSTNDHLNSTAAREVDEAWDEIKPGHGVVALDQQWAAAQGLPASMSLPSDNSKGVYILDAYHQIHCLVSGFRTLSSSYSLTDLQTIIRKTWYQMERGQAVTWPAGHTIHCFDALRQYIMCTAGDTLLYTMGRNKTGDGQFRQCRDWSMLRDWATEHTACYRDSHDPIPLEDHFGYCDGGNDGISWDQQE
jgi:hypothetical protein